MAPIAKRIARLRRERTPRLQSSFRLILKSLGPHFGTRLSRFATYAGAFAPFRRKRRRQTPIPEWKGDGTSEPTSQQPRSRHTVHPFASATVSERNSAPPVLWPQALPPLLGMDETAEPVAHPLPTNVMPTTAAVRQYDRKRMNQYTAMGHYGSYFPTRPAINPQDQPASAPVYQSSTEKPIDAHPKSPNNETSSNLWGKRNRQYTMPMPPRVASPIMDVTSRSGGATFAPAPTASLSDASPGSYEEEGMEMTGEIHIDGTILGQWVIKHLEHVLTTPSTGTTRDPVGFPYL
jgi:hypothetical protein